MRSASDRVCRAAACHAVLAVALLLALPLAAHAESMTFHLSVGDALASVDRYNAFLVSLGKRAHGVKLIPGGASFAGQSCAGFGSVFRLGSVTVLGSPAALTMRAPSRNGKVASALAAVFALAGVRTWTPPATGAESDVPFWAVVPATDGLRFAADAVTSGGDAGLLGPEAANGILRFSADVTGSADASGRYRFLVELYGRTSSQDSALVAAGERRCFTFVDLAPVDLAAFGRLVDAQVANPTLRSALQTRIAAIATAIDRRDIQGVLDTLAVVVASLVSRSPDTLPTATARLLTEAAFRVRRGILFRPAPAECGNGTRETGEACDGDDLGGFDCRSVGFVSGPLGCAADCRLDTSQCVAASVCGNGMLEAGEECDTGAANSDTLADACRTTCKRADCGDGVVDSFEDCEGKNLNGETCVTLGYSGGSLRCDAPNCEFDDERCTDD
jgi:hypothetical protein